MITSIIITRYFDKEIYGQYSYFIWLSSIFAVLANFGLNQTITKYLPRYFFKEDQKIKALFLLKKLLKFALGAGCIVTILLLFFQTSLENLINFQSPFKKEIIKIAILTILPLSLNAILVSILSAFQEFKKLSLIQTISSAVSLPIIITLILTRQNLVTFLWYFLIFNGALAIIWLKTIARYLKIREDQKIASTEAIQPFPARTTEIFYYSLWSYIGIIFTQIAWDRSEFLFLGLYSDSSNIAIYSLSYSLALLFIGAFGPINSVLTSITAEVVGTEKKDQLRNIFEHATKYMAIIMLPTLIYASLFLENLITFFYGKNFSEAAIYFPFLAISHVIAIVITPISNFAYFKNEVRRMTFFNIISGTLNVILAMILIQKYQLVGAIIANTASQFFSIFLVLINSRKYQLAFFNKEMLKVLSMNMGLGLIIFSSLFFNIHLGFKIIIALITIIFYFFLILRFAFNKNDLGLLQNLVDILPKKLQKTGNKILALIKTKCQT